MSKDKTRYALITGATGGIGSCFAMQLASMGFNLILTSTKKYELDFLKTTLSKRHKIKVKIVLADLSKESDIKKLVKTAHSVEDLSMLINNAGFGIGDLFENMNNKYATDMVKVHNLAVVDLTNSLLPMLLKSEKAYIINVSSLAGFFPFPNSSVYSATKSFLISFSESLHMELRKKGVRVQALCPGFTKTNFFNTDTKNDKKLPSPKSFIWMTPEKVVSKSLYNLKNKKNKVICIPGFHNRVARFVGSLVPRKLFYVVMGIK